MRTSRTVRLLCYLSFTALLPIMPALSAATISATSSATQSGGLYDYSYQFTVSGPGAGVDAFFLSTDDLSPLNVTFTDSAWIWAPGSPSQHGIDFYDLSGVLASGSRLGITFASPLGPQATHFVTGLDLSNSVTNTVTGIVAPTAAPEPATFFAIGTGFIAMAGFDRIRRLKTV